MLGNEYRSFNVEEYYENLRQGIMKAKMRDNIIERYESVLSLDKKELENMLKDVVNELDLSYLAMDKHSHLGTPPAKLVRLVLNQKDREIQMLRQGFMTTNT